MTQQSGRLRATAMPLVFVLLFTAVLLTHLTLLHLPYFWDEGGYYVPAALDFYRTGTLIPTFTNAHPPLPSVLLGTLWHIFGFHIFVTRITACAFAAGALTAVWALTQGLLGRAQAWLLAALTGVYPIWFAQSSLAHADIFAAAFTLAGLACYLTSPEVIGSPQQNFSSLRRLTAAALLFGLSVLSKETAIVQPVALCMLECVLAVRSIKHGTPPNPHRRWALVLISPLPVLCGWFLYHWRRTGYVFGNPEFLHYNATGNFTLAHVLYAFRIRFVHLFWQRNMWVPLALAAACLLLPSRTQGGNAFGLPRRALIAIGVLVAANLVCFSVLGGALLTRYLLPVYPLVLLLCLAVWREHIQRWPWLALLATAAFIPAIWINPFIFFAPEDNLTYRNMVLVQQDAIRFLEAHYPQGTVLTAWPVSADLTRPELGYTPSRFRVFNLQNFTPPELQRAMAEPGAYDTALVFTTHYTTPAFRAYLLTNPRSWRGRRYAADLDLSPAQIARTLGGQVVWQEDRYGEWAAVLHFNRTYNARVQSAR